MLRPRSSSWPFCQPDKTALTLLVAHSPSPGSHNARTTTAASAVPDEPRSSADGIGVEALDLVGPDLTDDCAAEEDLLRTRPRPANLISMLNENTKLDIAPNVSAQRTADADNDTLPTFAADTADMLTSPASSDEPKNVARDTTGSPVPTLDRLSLADDLIANDSKNSNPAHTLLGQLGVPSSSSKSNASGGKKASEDKHTTGLEAAPAQGAVHEAPSNSFKLGKLPQELCDQIYPDLVENFKEEILPRGWQENSRSWGSRRASAQRTHYDGPGHYVKRSYFKPAFSSDTTLQEQEEKGPFSPKKLPQKARHNRSRKFGVESGGKDKDKHRSEKHQRFVSPRMAVGGYKILMLGNKSFAAELASHVFQEMQINAKRRQDHGDSKVQYKSDDLRDHFQRHPEYAAYTQKLIIMVNLGQAKMTYEALVEILRPFKKLQHVLVRVFFAGLWDGALAPSIEKFRDLLILKKGLEREVSGSEPKERTVEFKFEHSVPQRSGQRLSDTDKAAMEDRYQKRWRSIAEWNGIGSQIV